MPDLTIKPNAGSGNKVILQDQAGGVVLTTADSGATLGNSTQDNITRLGTVTTGTMNNTIGSSATFPAGHVIQVKHSGTGSSYQTGGGSSNVFGDVTITNPSVVITPRDVSNKIFICIHACVHPAAHAGYASIYRNSSSTTEDHNLLGCTGGGAQIQGDQAHTITYMWYDTPGVVEEFTYRPTWRAGGTSQVVYFGNGGSTTRNTITVMEIEV